MMLSHDLQMYEFLQHPMEFSSTAGVMGITKHVTKSSSTIIEPWRISPVDLYIPVNAPFGTLQQFWADADTFGGSIFFVYSKQMAGTPTTTSERENTVLCFSN